MDNRLTTNGAANTEDETKNALVTRPHSRRTLITGAAMGLAGAAIGAAAIASPAGATTDRLGNSPRPNGKQKTDEISFSTTPALEVDGALTVNGPAVFSNSGVLSIQAHQKSANQTGVNLTSASLVLANLQNTLPKVFVEAVVPNVSGKSFEIVLSKAVPPGKTANVAWFVVN